jgi:hypothetical protein
MTFVATSRRAKALSPAQGTMCARLRAPNGEAYEIEGSDFDNRTAKLGINFLPYHNHADGTISVLL